ncbi:MAG: PAS domain-containing sensor histidine kinase [Sphingomonadales bacterium BRH_c42]|nr:MAG: PAS domain-containing sensor histidine kinase [Sphingomonadales bacterium BRH_c42]
MIIAPAILDQAPCPDAQISGLIFGLLLIDPDGLVAQVNQATEDLLGRSAKHLLGQHAGAALHVQDPRVLAHLDERGEALVARDIALILGDGEKRVNLTISPLSNFPGWRVLTLSELGRNDAEPGDAGELSGLGAPSILAHEIKNPLAAIRGAGQLVERKLDPQDRSLARMIVDEVDRIARLIDRMQQLGSSVIGPTAPCNLHEAIRSAIATVRAADRGTVEVVEEFDPSLPPVLANQDALQQVLINLISNARDAASSASDPRVTVKTRFVSGMMLSAIRLGARVRLPIEIAVIDNGPGIDPALRDHVFEPFVTSKKSGQGLGLALVRKLVRDMAGRISHDRDEKAGLTQFRIHLPLAREGAAR